MEGAISHPGFYCVLIQSQNCSVFKAQLTFIVRYFELSLLE